MKTCSACKRELPHAAFHRNCQQPDGFEYRCKDCRSVYRKATRDPVKIAAKQRATFEADPERVRAWKRASAKRRADANREKAQERARQYALRNPVKVQARSAVLTAMKRGDLVKPDRCEECGSEGYGGRIEAHHPDYSRPLDVRWLCTICHRAEHPREAQSEVA